jgi:hypothetical protein
MPKTYAEKAISELMEGRTITLDGYTYCYLQKDIPLVIEGIEFESSVPQLCWVARKYTSETESEPYLTGADHLTLGGFLAACSAKTFEDIIKDFPIKIPERKRDPWYQ